jgi:acetolactate synthase-1/3 small subunit
MADSLRKPDAERRATFAALVDNEPGVLHRVVGMFSARGYNIESLTVAETDHQAHTSRITVVTRGAPPILAQIRAQLEKIIQVRSVEDVGADPEAVERELGLIRLTCDEPERTAGIKLAETHNARIIAEYGGLLFEITGSPEEIDAFHARLRPLGPVEISRTGVLSIRRSA